jgi:CDP-6-deoxy-D-xylo-4-hexulose-3-dehydrase
MPWPPDPSPSASGVLVLTGGSGFVGRNLAAHLAAAGYDVHAPTRQELDLRNQRATERYLRAVGAATVVHAAGLVGGIAANVAAPVRFLTENLELGLSVVRACGAAGVTRLVNLSSSCVYPRDRERLAEADLLTGSLEPTNEGYALAKLVVARLCAYLSRGADARCYRTLLPCNLYGPHDSFDPERAHLLAAALVKVDRAAREGADTVEVWGDGQARREFMHVRDLCEGVVFVLERLESVPELLNVGPGVDHTVDEYYAAVARVVGWDGRLVHDLERPAGMRRKLLDVSRATALGWSARIPLEDGLRETYEWFREHRRRPRAAAPAPVTPALPEPAFPLASDSWEAGEEQALHAVIASRRFTMAGRVRAFEREFAGFLGSRHCVMVNSGSSANLLMAAALAHRSSGAVAPGAEIVVPAVGWATTYYPFTQAGYRLRFADVDPDTFNLDPDALAAAITPDTAAVCVVNVLGNPCDFPAIRQVLVQAEARIGREILLLEDNCESMGATLAGRPCGTFGLAGTFSFFFSHHISTMEGGMVCTDDDELAEIVTSLRAHGWTRDLPAGSSLRPVGGDPFEAAFQFVLPGYNVRPLELSAAVGSVQLARFETFLGRRRENARHWRARLRPLHDLAVPQAQSESGSWFGLSLRVRPDSGLRRTDVVGALQAAGVQCRPVVTGNFTRQPVCRRLEHTVSGPLIGADLVHDHGLYVGNAERPLDTEIDLVADVLHTLRPDVTVAERAA